MKGKQIQEINGTHSSFNLVIIDNSENKSVQYRRASKYGSQPRYNIFVEISMQLQYFNIIKWMEKLRVTSCFDAYYDDSLVQINAPRLRIILWEYNAITGTSCLQNLTSLCEASVGFFLLHEDISMEKLQSVCDLLSGLSHAHSLTLESQCIEVVLNISFFFLISPSI